jgi:photosystem II stability/assembly factor-like uncharacterized protein
MKFISVVVLGTGLSFGQSAALLDGLAWRNIGPAVMGGRISDIQGVAGDPATVFAASGSGGLFRTADGGMTWTPIFERQSTISIGAIALQPGNAKVIWVGTGESNVRNSVSFGDGLYKSEDGGGSWKKVGLGNTETIARIAIDPANPNHVLVAAVGHPFGPNEERGVFLTQDGGASWRKTLYVDDQHGASDVAIDPTHPNTVYAALWHFDRKPWTYTSGDEKGGVFKSTDGGLTWQKLSKGLPALMGRIGLAIAPSNPKTLYVLAESKTGTLFRSDDQGTSFTQISDNQDLVRRAYYFTTMEVAPDSADHIIVLGDALLESVDGGKRFHRMSPSVHGDLHALWIDPKDPRRMWEGNDGGLAVSYDGGHHWEQVNNIPLGQFYHVSADNREPFYNVTGGMQDNGSWTGPNRTREPAGIFNDDWRMVNPFTGFNSLQEWDDPNIVLTEQPGGVLLRQDLRTREQQVVGPQMQSFAGAPASEMKYRFNWDAPLVRSPHGKNTIYLAGNVIFQSSDYGRSWETISRDLTNDDKSKLGNMGGPITVDNSAEEVYSTITSLAESPLNRLVMWAGTDDGNVQVTTSGGEKWTNVAANLRGVAAHSPVSHVEPSASSDQTAYISLDRHMFDDMHPYIFKTADGGKSWTNISGNLPEKAFVWIVREDPREPRLLYAGTELGLFVSFSGGSEWVPLHLSNMPWSIAVRDIVVQPEKNDLIVATHGRSLWILDDVTPLQKMASAEASEAKLFPIRPAMRFTARATRYGFGDMTFTGANPAYGALLTYYVPANVKEVKLEILDSSGAVVRDVRPTHEPGLNRVAWDLRYSGPAGQGSGQGRGGGARGGEMRGPQAIPGHYTARLTADGKAYEQPLQVILDPSLQVSGEDLHTQFEVASGLMKMESAVNAALKKLTAMKGESSDAIAGELARPKDLGRSETGPRLKEQIEALYAMVDGVNAAPTAAQSRYYEQLQGEFHEAMAKVEKLVGVTTASN